MASKHAIIIVKNMRGEYLQYYENSWNGYLFLNCNCENNKDIAKISDTVLEKLGIKPLKIDYLFTKIHSKYSVKHEKMREYEHYFYLVDIGTEFIDKKEFVINNTKFKWLSMEELENDPEIMQINGDIIGFIKEWFTK